jgi:hypothetical protein
MAKGQAQANMQRKMMLLTYRLGLQAVLQGSCMSKCLDRKGHTTLSSTKKRKYLPQTKNKIKINIPCQNTMNAPARKTKNSLPRKFCPEKSTKLRKKTTKYTARIINLDRESKNLQVKTEVSLRTCKQQYSNRIISRNFRPICKILRRLSLQKTVWFYRKRKIRTLKPSCENVWTVLIFCFYKFRLAFAGIILTSKKWEQLLEEIRGMQKKQLSEVLQGTVH